MQYAKIIFVQKNKPSCGFMAIQGVKRPSFTGDRKDKEQLAAFSQSIMDRIAELKAENE